MKRAEDDILLHFDSETSVPLLADGLRSSKLSSCSSVRYAFVSELLGRNVFLHNR